MNSDLHLELLPQCQRELLDKLRRDVVSVPFYMAGGTALAIQLGHRLSMDFDFFVPTDINNLDLLARLRELGVFELFAESKNTIHGQLDGVQLSFITYKFDLLDETVSCGQVALAGLRDIACMKLDAIASRSNRRDFVDFYFILKQIPTEKILADYHIKTRGKGLSRYQLLKSLVYFKDAEDQPMPRMLSPIEWNSIKTELETATSKFAVHKIPDNRSLN